VIAGVLGVCGFVLALFAVGGFMEGDMGKVAKFGGGFVICAILILIVGGPLGTGGSQTCRIDWDGRANSEVCD
jgi:hypothetical protein